MASVVRALSGGAKSILPPEVTAGIDDFKALSDITNDILGNMEDYIREYNCNNSLNRLEKIGEAMINYSTKMQEREAGAMLSACKYNYDAIGKLYRVFTAGAEEYVIKPIRQQKEQYPAINNSIKALNKARDAMDSAADKARRKPDDPEIEAAKVAAETEFNAQLAGTKPLLEKVPGYYDSLGEAVKLFGLYFLQLIPEEKAEYDKMVANIKY